MGGSGHLCGGLGSPGGGEGPGVGAGGPGPGGGLAGANRKKHCVQATHSVYTEVRPYKGLIRSL